MRLACHVRGGPRFAGGDYRPCGGASRAGWFLSRALTWGLSCLRGVLAAWLWGQNSRLVLWLPVALAGGIVLYFTLPSEPGGVAMAGAVLACAASLACRLLWPGRLVVRLGAGAVGAGAVGFLLAWGQAGRMPPFPDLPHRAVHLSGQVTGVEVQRLADGTQALRVTLHGVRFDDGISMGMPPLRRWLSLRLRADDPARPMPGDGLGVRALLSPPAFPDVPGGYDAQRRAWFAGQAGHGRALDRATVTPARAAGGPAGWLAGRRRMLAERIRTALPGPRGDIAATILVGADGVVAAPEREAFADAGLAHLLAVAGLHLAIVMGLVMVVLRTGLALSERAALYWPCRQIAAVGALLAGAGYVVLTGAHLPAQRSLLMAGLAVLALLAGRRPLSLRALAVAATVLMALNPEGVTELPLQMSVAAVMALIAGFDALRPALSGWEHDDVWLRRVAARMAHPLLASVLAGSACMPVGMAHFGAVQPWFVLANLLAVPLMSVWIMPWGLAALGLMPVGLEKLALVPMGWGLGVVAWLAHLVARLPMARMDVPALGNAGLCVFFVGLCWLCLWAGRVRLLGLAPIVLAVLSPWMAARPTLLLAPDARMAGIVTQGHLLTGPGTHPDPFALREWQRVTGLPAGLLPAQGTVGNVACHGGICRVGDIVLVLMPRPPAPGLCQGTGLLVNLQGTWGCDGVPSIGRFDLWRNGAYGIYRRADGGLVVQTDRAMRGARPWVMRPGGAGLPNLPLAQAE
ncbi:competence protein ComE [Komagataeibacter sucrofermentans]|uniref:Competence protein ComE n=2 Tax=Komagataeibacter sucrofermentans TaxID=1053551 RepID=A0A318QPI4_9PROT|nr:competence protein ComE [Komagataeibacter sucrofermentans]GBQ43842.1 DNA translocation competence protein ComA/ComEC/Rec2 [Komagataeibacter sucrofermentans DSM 15973]